MPLVAATLQTSLQNLMTTKGASASACAALWATAFGSYAASVVPAATTVPAAQSALQAALTSAFASPSALTAMDAAFTAAALTIAGGMAPLFVGTPPPAPVGWASLLATPYSSTNAAAATKIANAVDAWMKTGKAQLLLPLGPLIPWS